MTEASEQMLSANGLRHHVVRWGDRPVDVVLCHGFLDIAWSFDAVARVLVEAGHGVASFDWRGHGHSQ
ncbi:MAG TPA: alpha/beta fold hydrolase, partial [Polyangiales bacterium]|nr:alpha/beta fold hydrolase [Polyangiales bacterium]